MWSGIVEPWSDSEKASHLGHGETGKLFFSLFCLESSAQKVRRKEESCSHGPPLATGLHLP